MYDLNRKIIFTHPPKCAGTSIEDMFGWIPDSQDSQSIASYKKIRHSSLQDHVNAIKNAGENISDFFKFSCIRNPWEVAVSFFYHDKNYETLRFKQNNQTQELPTLLKIAETNSFEDYINYQYRRYKNDYNFLETDKFFLIEKKYFIDYVVRYESFELDIAQLKEKYCLNVITSHCNKGEEREHYKKYYNSIEIINKVKEMANTTIELFGYSF